MNFKEACLVFLKLITAILLPVVIIYALILPSKLETLPKLAIYAGIFAFVATLWELFSTKKK